MIIYNQAFDIYHTIFRIASLLNRFSGESLEIERIRIWDFYLTFPQEVSKIRFGVKSEDRIIKNLFPSKENPYQAIMNPNKLFVRMQPYQLNAIKTLASYGVINKDYLIANRITNVDKKTLSLLIKDLRENTDREDNIIKIMTSYFYFMPLYGKNGLKDRTNLLEFRYDI
ncbi:ABC-three component system middle component 5 [uncultured Tenacibaculum sp.]|uniref:ABC-three component system middle component 5 n=1 Tax=uncultured Tenacibaculum sp. TaxID=174713 RepID=UPI00262C44F2|nr:ABC-three component system middle component 5 [uncultured Tenacibaculum sp.]